MHGHARTLQYRTYYLDANRTWQTPMEHFESDGGTFADAVKRHAERLGLPSGQHSFIVQYIEDSEIREVTVEVGGVRVVL